MSSPILLLKQVIQDFVSSVYPPRIKGRLKHPRNYNGMRRMRQVADQKDTKEEDNPYDLERHSSSMAYLLSLAKKRNLSGNLSWTSIYLSQLHLKPSLKSFLPLIGGKSTANSMQLINWHFHQGRERKRRNCISIVHLTTRSLSLKA
jgi:hypothetical protein